MEVNEENTGTNSPQMLNGYYCTQSELLKKVENMTIATLPDFPNVDPEEVERTFLQILTNHVMTENAVRIQGNKFKYMQSLSPQMVATFVSKMYRIVNVCYTEKKSSDTCLLAIYHEEGRYKGTYTCDEDEFYHIMKRFNYAITSKEREEVMKSLKSEAPFVSPCQKEELVAVNNGLFNYKTKELLPFTPDEVFVGKSPVDYNPNAQNVIIHNDEDGTDWSPEEFIDSLSEDPGVRKLLWQVMAAVLRRGKKFNKSAWLYETRGCNGKGTYVQVLRNLIGNENAISLSLDEMSNDYKLSTIMTASAILTDENDMVYIDKAANLKAIVTKDVILLNQKYKQPVAYRFSGFMVQCLNDMPRVKDKSDSFYRRQIFIPFMAYFFGKERTYIKDDYIGRKEVLEYFLYKALNTDFDDFDIPEVCVNALEEYKEANDPVRQFCAEILPECRWNLLPFQFLYDLYTAWSKRNNPNGTVQGRNTFIADLLNIIRNSDTWACEDKSKQILTEDKMDACEPLIAEYNLTEWMNPLYKGNDENKKCHPRLNLRYRGLLRK